MTDSVSWPDVWRTVEELPDEVGTEEEGAEDAAMIEGALLALEDQLAPMFRDEVDPEPPLDAMLAALSEEHQLWDGLADAIPTLVHVVQQVAYGVLLPEARDDANDILPDVKAALEALCAANGVDVRRTPQAATP